ncbi:UBA domain-containing protein [Psidium guajava]|nr:UBA domain-containing protein [Psidium guajava]
MAPAKSKSKSKNKSSARAGNEQKVASKTSGSSNGGNGSPASAYNPVSGTFHLLENSPFDSSPPSQSNGRFQTIDDTDEHSSSPHGTVSEYDSVSNNGSWSGESEDLKDKAGSTPQREPGPDNDRREKIRLKNEKKHQRQRERRAQELHERCSGYLMSRKLEALSQQLVSMGFSSERATLALMMNEGRLEDSISWLFDRNEEEALDKGNDSGRGNLKIDISEEIARITELEVKYKCSKQEVERAVVACEGDLVKAEESLRAQKQDSQVTPTTPEVMPSPQTLVRLQEKHIATMTTLQGRNERDLNYTKAVPIPPTDLGVGTSKLQSSKINRQTSLAEKRWPPSGLSFSPSSSIAMRTQVSPAVTKPDFRHDVAEEKLIQNAAYREPVIVMRRPQSTIPQSTGVSSIGSSPSVSTGYHPSDVSRAEILRSNMKLLHAQRLGSLGLENQGLEQLYHQPLYKESPSVLGALDTMAEFGGSWNTVGRSPPNAVPSNPVASWNKMGTSAASHTIPSSSLGLFSSRRPTGTLGSSSQVDWNISGAMPEFDYTRIDWTLDANLAHSKSSGVWLHLSSMLTNNSTMMLGAANRVRATDASPGGSCEWTSPFAGKDIFSLPRQFVTSPSP